MSTTYIPKRPSRVAKTPWSYADGGFDANVDGAQWLGRVHEYLELPIAKRRRGEPARVPWIATAAQARAWAERLTIAFKVFRIDCIDNVSDDPMYLRAWRDFLKTCGGYSTR